MKQNSENETKSEPIPNHHQHKQALKEALAILGDLQKPELVDSKQTSDSEKVMPSVDYQKVVETELKNLTTAIANLEQENLQNIAKIQTMARRHGEENLQIRKYGGAELAHSILKPLDLFKKILASPVKSEEVKNYLSGFEMIAKQLDQALANNGIQQIAVQVGDDFDPRYHEATEVIETTTVPSGKIAVINSNGYKLHDRIITHALVKVAK